MILETIAKSTRMRVEKKKQILSLEEIKQLALNQEKKGDFPFEKGIEIPLAGRNFMEGPGGG